MPFEADGGSPRRRKTSVSKMSGDPDFSSHIEPAFAAEVTIKGFLQKLSSGMMKRYQKRYFELAGTYLKYFENAFPRTRTTIKGIIHLDGMQSCALEEEKIISIVLEEGRALKLKASTAETAQNWVKEINAAAGIEMKEVETSAAAETAEDNSAVEPGSPSTSDTESPRRKSSSKSSSSKEKKEDGQDAGAGTDTNSTEAEDTAEEAASSDAESPRRKSSGFMRVSRMLRRRSSKQKQEEAEAEAEAEAVEDGDENGEEGTLAARIGAAGSSAEANKSEVSRRAAEKKKRLAEAEMEAESSNSNTQAVDTDIESEKRRLSEARKGSQSPSHDASLKNALKAKRAAKKVRGGIFSEKVDSTAVPAKRPSAVVPKSIAAKASILSSLDTHFLFSAMTPAIKEQCMNAMTLKTPAPGDDVIVQGDKGDYFYIVESGDFEIFVDRTSVASVGAGGSFGELALLYNCPRAATVTVADDQAAGSEVRLWALDRHTFRNTLAASAHADLADTTGALQSVPLLSSLTDEQLTKMAEAVQPVSFKAGEKIIHKGEEGSVFYIIKEGKVVCSNIGDGKLDNLTLKAGDYFGERALLMNEPRAADVVAETAVRCMALDREGFTELLGPLRQLLDENESNRVLQHVPLLKALTSDERSVVSKACVPRTYETGERIISQGDKGEDFFIVRSGRVNVSQTIKGAAEESHICSLAVGDFFGEMALLKDDEVRAANVTADKETVCLSLTREKFTELLGPLSDILKRESTRRNTDLQQRQLEWRDSNDKLGNEGEERDLKAITLDHLNIMSVLGQGTFGTVKLVQHKETKEAYALKILSKQQVVELKQQSNVMSERDVMVQATHPFVLQLVATMRDDQHLYMLLDLCLGGELFNYLHCNESREEEYIPDEHALFFASCVLDVFDYLHGRLIVYRDLKPENLLLDSDGYIKVVDFGFAKVLADNRSYTLCGTPEYLAPELVLGQGHGKGVDYWALGVLIYEMVTGYSPFAGPEAPDQMVIFRNIIKNKILGGWQPSCSLDCKDVIEKFMTKDIHRRLGCMKDGTDDAKSHPWFNRMDFSELRLRKLAAPWVPPIKNPLDTAHFDELEEEEDEYGEYLDDGTGWDDGF